MGWRSPSCGKWSPRPRSRRAPRRSEPPRAAVARCGVDRVWFRSARVLWSRVCGEKRLLVELAAWLRRSRLRRRNGSVERSSTGPDPGPPGSGPPRPGRRPIGRARAEAESRPERADARSGRPALFSRKAREEAARAGTGGGERFVAHIRHRAGAGPRSVPTEEAIWDREKNIGGSRSRSKHSVQRESISTTSTANEASLSVRRKAGSGHHWIEPSAQAWSSRHRTRRGGGVVVDWAC